jgi:hypothetical protein
MATVHPLPHIVIKIDTYDGIKEYVEENASQLYESVCRTCSRHRVVFSILTLVLVIAGFVIYIVIKNNSTTTFPCIAYSSETLAKDVSVTCLTYLWTQNNCKTAIDSSPTWMWWLQSPQGLTTVKCDNVYTGLNCGAGSFNTILVYTQLCNPFYRG